MNIEYLREFSYLAECLSFNVTSKHFFISTSTLSKHVAAMEDELGTRLFERDRHGVELTAAGKTFYEDIIRVLADYDRALDRLAANERDARKPLRVGYLRGAAHLFLAAFVRHIEEHFPHIDLDIVCMEYRELIDAIHVHKVDAVLTMEVDPAAQLVCEFERIYTDRINVVVSEGHELAARAKEGIAVAELRGMKMVLPEEDTYPGYAQRCDSIVAAAGGGETVHRYHDIDTLLFMLLSGDCMGFSSGHNADYFSGKAVLVPINNLVTSYDVSACWLKGLDADLADVLRQTARFCAEYMAHRP